MAQEQKKPRGFANAKKSVETSAQSAAPVTEKSVSVTDALAKLEAAGKVKVIHGANDEEIECVGAKVQQVRANLVHAFNIPGDASSFVNGKQVDDNYTLQQNDTLEFIKAAGVKGHCDFEKLKQE